MDRLMHSILAVLLYSMEIVGGGKVNCHKVGMNMVVLLGTIKQTV